MTFEKSLFIFRRDLRLQDNTGLIKALKESKNVVPCFIFDPRQVEKNQYKSDNLIQFMVESLEDLNDQLKKKQARLYLFYGRAEDVVARLIKKEKIDAIYVNSDYTPFSKKRDKNIGKFCSKNSVEFIQTHDLLLHPPGTVLKSDGKPYTVFTPFFKKANQENITKSVKNNYSNYYTKKISLEKKGIYKKILKKKNSKMLEKGGRNEALKILKNLKKLKNYKHVRDYPAKQGTTRLSAHNKFGTVSIREVYHAVTKELTRFHEIIAELHWRDFFTQIAHYFPHVFKGAFHKKYDKIKWENNKKKFNAWCTGKTGFPIVDAGMRELNTTGYMHNRVRMIVASFLVKDLHIDWKKGEKYFAQKLVDYDVSINNGNWQWAASTGCDAQPYFRIFNPWLQQKKYDANCDYIKKWVPELKNTEPWLIHSNKEKGNYPKPIVDHKKESKKAKISYSKIKK